MAMNTAAKRYSAITTGLPWRGVNTLPSGTVTQAERQSAAFLYSGILADEPPAPESGPLNIVVDTVRQTGSSTIGTIN